MWGAWHFAKLLPLCDLSDAVQDAEYQQSDDDKAAENDEAEKAPSHRLAPTMCKWVGFHDSPSCLQGLGRKAARPITRLNQFL
jgi:hypothetical protein